MNFLKILYLPANILKTISLDNSSKVSPLFIFFYFRKMVKLINFKSFQEFLKSGTVGGIILIVCVIISLFIANSSWSAAFSELLETKIGYHSTSLHLEYPIILWINDGLMAIFFLLVGLEIKRKLIEGELATFKKASLPVFAATGGVIIPAAIYFLLIRILNSKEAGESPWQQTLLLHWPSLLY